MAFTKHFSKYLVFAALVFGSFLLAPLLPVSVGWENGLVENAQTLTLFAGGIWALWCWHASDGSRIRVFWLTIASVWFVLAVKELGWGVAFMQPLSHSDEFGPGFSSSAQLWYKPAVVAVLVCLVLIWAWGFVATRQSVTVFELLKRKALPVNELLIVLLLMMISASAEGNMSFSTGLRAGTAQVYEELVELLAYLALLLAQYRIMRGMNRARYPER